MGVALAAAKRFGTPLYLYDLTRLRADARAVADAFPDPWLRLYSLKANGLPALVRSWRGRIRRERGIEWRDLAGAARRADARADRARGHRQDFG